MTDGRGGNDGGRKIVEGNECLTVAAVLTRVLSLPALVAAVVTAMTAADLGSGDSSVSISGLPQLPSLGQQWLWWWHCGRGGGGSGL